MSEKFGIVGYGVVGQATHLSLFPDSYARIHDVALNTTADVLTDCTVVFVCIPTDNPSDVMSLINSVKEVKEINRNCLIIVRSTIPVGTCNKLQLEIDEKIIYMPEFLRDRCWTDDCKRRPLVIGTELDTLPTFLEQEESIVCSLEDAEALKMFGNNFAALRVVFANHMYDLCSATGADYNAVVALYSATAHDQSYLDVEEELRGFGGKCLPKDLSFLIESFNELGLTETLFQAVEKDNSKWPTTLKKS